MYRNCYLIDVQCSLEDVKPAVAIQLRGGKARRRCGQLQMLFDQLLFLSAYKDEWHAYEMTRTKAGVMGVGLCVQQGKVHCVTCPSLRRFALAIWVA